MSHLFTAKTNPPSAYTASASAGLANQSSTQSSRNPHNAARDFIAPEDTPAQRKRARTKKWLSENREWRRAYDREYRKRHPEMHRAKDRRQYAAHAEKKRQSAREYARREPQVRRKWMGYPEPTRPMPDACESCGNASRRKLHLDHDHVTGAFRGWLCGSCNRGIGYLRDTIDGVRKALAYLERAP